MPNTQYWVNPSYKAGVTLFNSSLFDGRLSDRTFAIGICFTSERQIKVLVTYSVLQQN